MELSFLFSPFFLSSSSFDELDLIRCVPLQLVGKRHHLEAVRILKKKKKKERKSEKKKTISFREDLPDLLLFIPLVIRPCFRGLPIGSIASSTKN